MALELWMQDGDVVHYFMETSFGDVIVGRAEPWTGGTWSVEVNGDWFYDIPDLEAAKRLFVDKYDKAYAAAQCGPGSSGDGDREGFTIVKLRTTRSPFRQP